MALTAAKVKAATKRGMHCDGHNLYLRVAPGGSKGWILRISIDGKRRDIGLGGYPTVSLAKARRIAEAHRVAVAEGRDPLSEKRREKMPTFAEAARKLHNANKPRWSNGKHVDQWLRSLEVHAMPTLGQMALHRIRPSDVLSVLTPIWAKKPETARRVRQRIRKVLEWGEAHGFIERNAAGEAINGALPPMPRLVTGHFRSLAYTEVPAALKLVDASGASLASKLCLRFLVLTAARSGEARGALWSEIEIESGAWVIPANRMKMKKEHRVPLSDAALAVLDQARSIQGESDLIFGSPTKIGAALSNVTLTMVLRRAKLADRATVHGFRSSFRDWCAETGKSRELAEAALSHAVLGVEGAYFRSDLFERRRALMDEWAQYVEGQDNVVRLYG